MNGQTASSELDQIRNSSAFSGRHESAHSLFLDGQREHHDHVHVVLPDHLPEVIDGGWHRALRRDVLPLREVALRMEGISF